MSTTRITIAVRQITIGKTANGKREIKILAGHGTGSSADRLANNDVWSEDGNRIKNKVGSGVEKPNTFRTDTGGATDVNISDIHGIKLTLPDKLAELVYFYIQWKEKIKDKKDNNEFTITLKKINYQDVIGTAAEGLPNSFPNLDDDCLVLDESSFLPTEGGKIDSWGKVREVVEINNFDNTQADYNKTDKKDFDGTPRVANDPSEKQVFADLVRYYCQIYNSAIPNEAELDKIEKELFKFISTTDIDYDHSHATTEDNAKKTIYRKKFLIPEEAHGGGRSKCLAREIKWLHKYAQELKVWRKIGFDSIEDVLRANKNGYWIAERRGGTELDKDNSINDETNWGKLDEGTKEGKSNIQAITEVATDNQSIGLGGGKYKGFPIIDRERQRSRRTAKGSEKNEKFFVISEGKGELLEFKGVKSCMRKGIDNLRKLEVKDSSDNEVAELSIFKDINKVAAKDLFGFQPGDMNESGEFWGAGGIDLKKADNWKVVKGGKSSKDHQMTRIKFKLKDENNNYEEFITKIIGDVVETNQITVNHYLDEFGSHQATMDEYYDFVKNNKIVEIDGKSYNDDDENNKELMKIIDWTFYYLGEWATIWDKDYSQKDKQECQEDRKRLEDFLATTLFNKKKPRTEHDIEKMVKSCVKIAWPKQLTDKLTQIDNRLEAIWKGGDKGDIKKQIREFLATGVGKNWSETAKKVFLENLNEITSEIFAALKTLVPLLESAYGNNADNLADLEKYSSAEASKAGEEDLAKAWEMANKLEIEDGKGWATHGLEKMTNKVVTARAAAKTLLDDVDKDDAYNAIGIADIKKISEINAIKDLFSQAKQGYAMTSRDSASFATVLLALTEAKNANNEAWKKVNLYKKDDKKTDYSDGYAAGAWKKLEGFKKKAVADFNKAKAATTETELEEILKEVITAATDTATKEKWEKVDGPRMKARLKLNQNEDKEKELIRILGVNIIDSSEYQDDEAGLKKIDEDINTLREYKEAKSDEEKGQVFAKIKSVKGIDYAITEFIKQMESKKELIKAALKKKEEEEHNKKDDLSTTNGTPWYKNPIYIGIIVVAGIILIIGAAFYFMKENGEEKNDNE